MQMKKVVSLIMVLVMLLTVAIIPTAFSAADKDAAATSVNTTTDYALAPNIQSGNILHAFNWRMRDLVKYAPDIAAAGYTSVQISPVQYTKATVNDGSYATDWWSFYQPRDMSIGNALGTADEVQAATTELHKYGVKVIADVVTNHVQNCTTRTEAADVNATLRGYTRNSNLLTHSLNADDSDRRHQVQGDLDNQLPDINTGNTSYQQYVINNLLNPLADKGVDGFRFDAAKHIETPDDGSYASQYWPNITSAIKAKNSNAYIYGEILDSAGKFQISSYTKYINVTDWAYGNTVRNALNSKNASGLVNYGYSGSSKNQNVLWVESHDNFCSGASTGLTKQQQILGWAAIGGRKDAPALFYVRPKHEQIDSAGFIKYDDLMGAPGSAETWKDPTVVAVNHFKNAFAGQDENVSANGSKLFVQRGTSGMLIVDLNGSGGSVSQTCTMANGTYKDQVSGNSFTVSGGKITGNIGSTGVAVVYNTTAANTAPEIKLSLNGTELTPEVLSRYTDATATVKVDLKNATSAQIKVSNLDAKTVTGSTTFTLKSSIPYGKSIDVKITATNGQKTVERTYNIKKKNPNETKKVYFDNSAMKWPYESTTGSGTVGIFVMCKTGVAASTKIGSYDSHKMTPVSGQNNLYSYDVPSGTNYVKFNEGFIGSQYTDKSHMDSYGRCHLFHTFNECQGYCGRTMPETVVNFGTANSASNRENGGYQLVGAMIMRDLRFEDYGDYPVATLTNADTSLTEGGTDPTTPPTDPPTEPPVGRPILRGDADQDTFVSVLDATMMQRHMANIKSLSEDGVLAADIDSNKKVETIDVTYLQRYLAGIGTPYHVNEIFYVDGDAPNPTTPQPTTPQPTTPQPTDPPAPTDPPTPTDPPEPTSSGQISFLLTDNFNWGTAYVYAWDANGNALCGEWPGASQAETITNGYGETQFRCYVPDGAVGVILNNGNGAQTEDITDFGTYEGYWMDGTKNNLGHYKVTGWNS